jgi:hypothetical protein
MGQVSKDIREPGVNLTVLMTSQTVVDVFGFNESPEGNY